MFQNKETEINAIANIPRNYLIILLRHDVFFLLTTEHYWYWPTRSVYLAIGTYHLHLT